MGHRQSVHARPFVLGRSELTAGASGAEPRSLVDRIFKLVAVAIQTRQLAPGARLPSIRQLAEDCEISRDTSARAYDKLVAHGLIESRRGAGFYAKSSSTRQVSDKRATHVRHFNQDPMCWRLRLLRPGPRLLSCTGSGVLPESWMDEGGITSALRAVARGSQRTLAQHGDPQGYLPLRQQLHLKLQDLGIQTDADHIIVTGGATDALNLIVHTLVRDREQRVLVEEPGPHFLIDRLMSCGMDVAFVPRLADGPDLSVLRAMCEKHRPKFFFCSSVLHNPTSSVLAPHKAFQILRLAEEFDLTIIEDDTYGDLMPNIGATPAARLAPLDLCSESSTSAASPRRWRRACVPGTWQPARRTLSG